MNKEPCLETAFVCCVFFREQAGKIRERVQVRRIWVVSTCVKKPTSACRKIKLFGTKHQGTFGVFISKNRMIRLKTQAVGARCTFDASSSKNVQIRRSLDR